MGQVVYLWPIRLVQGAVHHALVLSSIYECIGPGRHLQAECCPLHAIEHGHVAANAVF